MASNTLGIRSLSSCSNILLMTYHLSRSLDCPAPIIDVSPQLTALLYCFSQPNTAVREDQPWATSERYRCSKDGYTKPSSPPTPVAPLTLPQSVYGQKISLLYTWKYTTHP